MSSNLRQNPLTGAFSYVDIVSEAKTIAQFDFLPGIFGFILDERPNPDPLTMTFTEDVSGGSEFDIIISGTPAPGQVRVDEDRGMCFFNIADDTKDFLITYKGGGTNNTLEFLQSLLIGSPYVSPENTVEVNTNRVAVPGESFLTWAAADTFVALQTPSSTNRWAIRITGTNSEAIVIRSWVSIVGIRGATRLTGAITSVVGFAFNLPEHSIVDCVVTDLATTGGFGVTLFSSDLDGGTPAGGIVAFQGSNINGGDYSSMAAMVMYSSVVNGGELSSGFFHTSTMEGQTTITLNGGTFFNCDVEFNGSDIVANQSDYDVRGGIFGSGTVTLNLDTDSRFSNVSTVPGSSVTLKPAAGATLDIDSIGGDFIIDKSLGGVTVNTKGDFYDAALTGIVAKEMQGVIDSLAPDTTYQNDTADSVLGTTNTAIFRFSGVATVDKDVDGYWTITNSAASGWALTFDKACVASLDGSMETSTGVFGISLNATVPEMAASFVALPQAKKLSYASIGASEVSPLHTERFFSIGDVLRFQAVPGATITIPADCLIVAQVVRAGAP